MFVIWLFISYLSSSVFFVSFKYNDIVKKLNPDGTHFNIYEMLSDDVLNSVCKQLNNNRITPDRLRKCISIQDLSDIAKQNAIENSIINGGMPNSHCPNKFSVKCYSGLLYTPSAEIANALIPAYKEYFANNHIERNSVLKPDLSYLTNKDNLKSAEYLELCLNEIHGFAYKKYTENSDFVSEQTHKSFNDIAVMANDLITNELYNLKIAAVNVSSKDYNKAQLRYNNLNQTYNRLYQIYTVKYFANSKASIFYKSKVNQTSLDKAAADYYSSVALKYQSDIEYIKTKETNNGFINDNIEYISNSDADYANYTEKLLNDVTEKVKKLSDTAVKTEEDYVNNVLNAAPLFSKIKFGPSLEQILVHLFIAVLLSIVSGIISICISNIIEKQNCITVIANKMYKYKSMREADLQ